MAQQAGTNYTQTCYECSRDNASVKIDNTNWINTFSEGIVLNRGDQVRLLGNFIQEGANSNEIEISTDQELNLSYSPFLMGNTLDTIDKSENGNLIDLAQIGDLAYSTDSFGIEPPMRNTEQQGLESEGGNEPLYWQQNNIADEINADAYPTGSGGNTAKNAPTNRGGLGATLEYQDVATTNPAATGENGGDVYGNWNFNPWYINGAQQGENPAYRGGINFLDERETMKKDSANTWGTNLITDHFNTDRKLHNLLAKDYTNFSENNVPTEMYVGHMVKKFILPVLDTFQTFNTDTDPTGEASLADPTQAQTHTLEDLMLNAPASGVAGCLAGVPRVGMFIATVDIAQSSGWFDADGIGYYENKWGNEVAGNDADFDGAEEQDNLVRPRPRPNPAWRFAGAAGDTGKPNLKSGVQSVVGEIIAVRAIKQHILGKTQNAYEIYVSNFVNPAQLHGVNAISHQFSARELTNGTNFATTTAPKTVYKRVHGSSNKVNGYNYNPTFNNLNGAKNTLTALTVENQISADMRGGYKAGMNSGVPLGYNYFQSFNTRNPSYATNYANGGDSVQANQEDIGITNPEGLSFLWNGTHTGARKTSRIRSNYNRFRANSILQPLRLQATIDELCVRHLITDCIYTLNPPPTWQPQDPLAKELTFLNEPIIKQQGSVPVCLGAYVICNRDTMLDICKGNLDSNNGNNFYAQAGRSPRIWMDWGFQERQSHYTTRHYVGNSWDCTDPTLITTAGTAVEWVNRFPGKATESTEKRWGYSFIGRPNNMNWRSSVANNGANGGNLHTAQDQNKTFTAPAYTTYWEANTAARPVVSDRTPLYYSSPTGAAPAAVNASTMRGLPLVNAGYNTCINSIYFQQKDTGDTTLGLTSWRAKTVVKTIPGTAGGIILGLDKNLIDIDTGQVQVMTDMLNNESGQWLVKVLLDDCQFNPVEQIATTVETADNYEIRLYHSLRTGGVTHSEAKWLLDIPVGTEVMIYYNSSGGCGAGINAQPWSSDMIMVKESISKFKVPAGFYTEEQLAEEINNALHFNTEKYKEIYGNRDANNDYSIPSNVGLKERARTCQPSVVNGAFMHTYLPDVSYGFSPITTTNATKLELEPQTKDLTTELLTYEPVHDPNTNIFTYYYPSEYSDNPALAYNGTTRRRITDHTTEFPTAVGTHLKVYSIPNATSIPGGTESQKELSLIRLRGGALLESEFDATTGRWNNVKPRMVGNLEVLRSTDIAFWASNVIPFYPQDDNPAWQSTLSVYAYRTRLTRNLFPNGGSARVLCGANDFTLSWEEGANRFSLNKLFTPLRPHQVESQTTPPTKSVDFGIGDAIPSAIISAKHTGKIVSQLTGIYINDLNANAFNQKNWGNPGLGDFWEYDIETNTEIETTGQNLLTILGYPQDQVDATSNSFNLVEDIFTYRSDLLQSGSAIRVGAKITPAVNASNPVASRCLNLAPIQQFFVQVDTDDYFANDVPLKGSSPYYFIGSNFPSKQFYGNLNGAKLPIIGICSRNFSAFNFVFDLGGSSISFLVSENTTITHIETKIYDSNLKSPTNLSPSSSVIYLITRYNYANPITNPLELQQIEQLLEADNDAPIVNEFYSQPTANIRTAPPAMLPPANSNYYTGFGEIVPEADEDSDSD